MNHVEVNQCSHVMLCYGGPPFVLEMPNVDKYLVLFLHSLMLTILHSPLIHHNNRANNV